MTSPESGKHGRTPTAPVRSSFWRSMKVVAWGFFGVRKASAHRADLAGVSPLHVALGGLLGLVLLVLVLVAVVHWVVAGT